MATKESKNSNNPQKLFAFLHNGQGRHVEDREIVRIIYYSKGPVHFFESTFIDQKYEQYTATADPQEQDQLLREIGNYVFEEYATLPLFWLHTEFVVNPKVVADYKTSGIFPPGTWSTSKPYSNNRCC